MKTLVALVVLVSGFGVRAARAQTPRSPALARLDALGGDTLETGPFWRRAGSAGTPLVEPLSGTDSVLVTFVWRGTSETENAAVFGALTGWLAPANLMERLPRTDVWYRSVAAGPDVRFTYRISENDNLRTYWRDPDFAQRSAAFRPDPLNPDTVPLNPTQDASHFTGPGFVPDPWTPVRVPQAGHRDSLSLSDRLVVVYVPPAAEEAREVGLVVTLDGGAFDALVSTPATVEALTGGGVVPPAIVVMIHSRDRNVDLPPNAAFTSFVADTLIGALRASYPVSADPARNVVVGSSLGGLAAAWLGYRLPSVFGNVVAQSGAYWWSPPGGDGAPWLPQRYANGQVEPLRMWVEAGALETQPVRGGASMLRLTQHFRDILCARGYVTAYSTFAGGHEYESWRSTLPRALTWIFSGAPGNCQAAAGPG